MERLIINRENPTQENFLGVNAVYHGYAGLPDDAGRVYSDEFCELEADRMRDLGVKIVRTYYKWWAWSRKDGWNWENETMTAFYKWCKRMQDRGIDIALHGGWCCPGDTNGTSWGGDGPFADGDVSFETACDNFADFVSESLHQLIEVRGFTNIKYLMLFTESQQFSGKAPKEYTPFSAWEKASRTIHNHLVKDGRRHLVKLIGPNENARCWNYPKGLEYAAEHAGDFLDSYGCHIYARYETEDRDSVHTGKRAAFFCQPGQRIGQAAELKPNTDYEVECWFRVFAEDYLHLSGFILLGAFEYPQNPERGMAQFTAGGEATKRFNVNSVTMCDPAPHQDNWFKITCKFNSGEDGKCVIGAFYDLKNAKCGYMDDISLVEVGSDENLIANPSFEEETIDWWGIYSTPVSYDIFNDWYIWGKTMKDIINGKGLWYDECNSVHGAQNGYYTDPLHGTRYAMGTVALMNAGVETSLIWSAIDQQWPNNHTNNNDSFKDGVQHCGMMPLLTESKVPRPTFYAFQMVANYVGGNGCTVYGEKQGAERLHAAVSERPDGYSTALVVNMNNEEKEFSLDLGKPFEGAIRRHIYNPKTIMPDENATIIPSDKEFDEGTHIITDKIPANSVVIYTNVPEIK